MSNLTIDANPREQFVYNMAGVAGSGGSSYIDSMILRDRDANTAWASAADSTLEERVYYCQNWRADVISLFTDAGQLINQVRYDPYGVPFGISKADLNADGAVNTSDVTRFGNIWAGGSGTHPLADWNFDGSVNTSDYTAFLNSYNADTALGRGNLSYIHTHLGGDNRKAYAGYELDPVLADADAATGKNWQGFYHVRYRIYISQLGIWSKRDMDQRGFEGQSLYALSSRKQQRSIDPSGLRTINFEFNAFIPAVHGQAVCNSTGVPQNYLWSNLLLGWFATDDRTIGQLGSSRLSMRAGINSTSIGFVGPAVSFHGSDPSFQANGTQNLILCNGISTKTATRKASVWDPPITRFSLPPNCSSDLQISAKANNPFVPFSPTIDWVTTWHFAVSGTDKVSLSATMTHDEYPWYEAVLRSETPLMLYSYFSRDSKPTLSNLTTVAGTFTRTRTINAPTHPQCAKQLKSWKPGCICFACIPWGSNGCPPCDCAN